MEAPIPWSYIWFFFAIMAFVFGFAFRDDIRKVIDGTKKPVKTRRGEKRDEPMPPKPDPQQDVGGGMCVFENEDLILKQVYDYTGKRVTGAPSIKCSDCNQYLFKDEDGCVPYGFDLTENGGKTGGVCTIGGYVKKACKTGDDCTNGTSCEGGFCSNPPWVIPDSKVCPF